MNKLTTECLEQFVNDIKTDGMCDITDSQVESALIQLLAYEQAAKNPVAWTDSDELEDANKGYSAYLFALDGEANKYADPSRKIMLYAAPVLPKQPELPQGFTYESGILTTNFGNGDVLISDTHWPESGHAGISFAPVPQPKRPNLSDYTDLLGGSKTEEIGTLFIVKSNNAESLIAIRNKLDIAINVLSPAPAQPVIPEQPEPTISFYRDGIIAAAKWVENQRDAYDNEHGQSDPDTGAFEFGNDAQLEYSTTLSEIAEGIRSLHPASAQPVSEPYKLNGWINVNKELPEEGAHVLVFSDGAFVLLAEFTGGEFYDVARDGGEFFETVTRCVTHWMPLPAAPAQESE